jgi:hypothetical protein
MTPNEIEDECLENNHAVRLSIVEDRAVPIVCSECKQKMEGEK